MGVCKFARRRSYLRGETQLKSRLHGVYSILLRRDVAMNILSAAYIEARGYMTQSMLSRLKQTT